MTERVGFEPTVPLTVHTLSKLRLKPLGHLSNKISNVRII